MRSEVFAEDIEALLARLAGVAGARVVATEAGEIDRIFVTAFSDHDPVSIRRAITAALMSEYALSVAGWRIHVARLRTEADSPPLAIRLHRLHETLAGSSARTVVELQAADETTRFLGAAKGSADPQTRLRLAAEATLHALRPVLVTEDRKAEVEDIIAIRLAGGLVVVVAIKVTGATAATTVGAAVVEDAGEAEAAVGATLDALVKRGARSGRAGGRGMKNRREQLDALRSDYRRLRGSLRPAATPAGASDATGDRGVGASAGNADDRAVTGSSTPVEDTSTGLGDIRPERRGGAMEGRADRAAPPRRGMEDEHFRQLVERHASVDITCRDGYQILRGVILDYGTYSLMVQTSAGRELIFKHAIISVRESDQLPG